MVAINDLLYLIGTKREGPYWDFKREWYEEKFKLLHDIICMANNTVNRDCYIIIGIDEENGYSIKDVLGDPNRKTTQNLVDFLRDKNFAGSNRPQISVDTFIVNNRQLDVITIYNTTLTPYYLTEHFREVCANNIYTRVEDSNTPRNRSADIGIIEWLWKKRFGLLVSLTERIYNYLKEPDNWSQGISELLYYHEFESDLKIEFASTDLKEEYKFKILATEDEYSCYKINIYSKKILIYSFDGLEILTENEKNKIILDPFRAHIYLKDTSEVLDYAYLIKGSIEFYMLCFLKKKYNGYDVYPKSKEYVKSILFFDTENEQKNFNNYIEELPMENFHFCEEARYRGMANKLREEKRFLNSKILQDKLKNWKYMQSS